MIPLNRADIGEEEIAAVVQSLRGGHLCGDGPATRRVEQWLADRLGVPRVLLTTSCTHALELALMALDVGPGDVVILPSFTFVSTANAVIRQGATPVFADISPDTFNLDPDDVAHRITSRTRAIMPVHYAGVGCEMDALARLAEAHGLLLIEDAAQALDATYRGRALGTLGDAGAFSFHETKNVTCGEGGALILRDPAVTRRAEVMREKGTNRAAFLRGEVDRYTWVDHGSSFVMADLLAALLEAQLQRWDDLQTRRSRWAAYYLEALEPLQQTGLLRLPCVPPEAGPNWHLFHFTVTTEEERDRCLRFLRARGIGAAFHFVPLHSSPYGRRLSGDAPLHLPVTDRVSRTVVRIPLHAQLTAAEAGQVVDSIYEFFNASLILREPPVIRWASTHCVGGGDPRSGGAGPRGRSDAGCALARPSPGNGSLPQGDEDASERQAARPPAEAPPVEADLLPASD